jgi:hypothetical protein
VLLQGPLAHPLGEFDRPLFPLVQGLQALLDLRIEQGVELHFRTLEELRAECLPLLRGHAT